MKQKQNLLFIIDSLGAGGAQRQMIILIKQLVKNYATIDLITYSKNNFFKDHLDGLFVNHIQLNRSMLLPFKIATFIKKNRYNCIISYLKGPNTIAYLSKVISLQKIPNINSERSRTNWENKNFWSNLNILSNKKARFLVTNSYHEKENWVNRHPKMSSRVFAIHNAVDLEIFCPPKENKIKKIHNKIICVGRIVEAKNCECVIHALKLLNDNNNLSFKLDWIGRKVNNTKKLKSYIDKLENMVVDYGLSSKWNWLPETDNLTEHYRNADALILASHREGLPNVVCESLSCGTPVILANNLDNPFLVDNDKNGFLFDQINPEDLAEKLDNFYSLTYKEILEKKNNARKFATKHFSFENYSYKYIDVINKAVSNN